MPVQLTVSKELCERKFVYITFSIAMDMYIPANFLASSFSVFELCWLKKKKKKMMNKTLYHSPIHLWCYVGTMPIPITKYGSCASYTRTSQQYRAWVEEILNEQAMSVQSM